MRLLFRPMPLALVLTAAACSPGGPAGKSTEKAAPAETVDLATLQALAAKACKCRMAGRDSSAIESRYARLAVGQGGKEMDAAGELLSAQVTCFAKLGHGACVLNSVRFADGSPDDFVCTAEQSVKLSGDWERERRSVSLGSANALLVRQIAAMHAEQAKALPQSACDMP